MALLHQLVVRALPLVPRYVMRRLSARYIAGERLGQALEVLCAKRDEGYSGVLDILGEDVTDEAQARAALEEYKQGASAMASQGLDSYVSVKPTHFGLRLSTDLAFELYAELLEHCRGLSQLARIEMEDHTTTDDTLALYQRLRGEFENVGTVLQARLLRTPADIDDLGDTPGQNQADVRMVKGIYLESAEIAHTDAGAIRDAYVDCTRRLWERGHRVALATHDEELGDRLLTIAADIGVPQHQFCFEVLLGVQEPLWEKWRRAGVEVRVYVPFGREWRSYSQRRLRKNPEVFRHVLRNLLS